MGTRPASAPWLFPLLSLRSDRALAAPLTGSFPCPLPGPTAAALRPRGSALGGWQWPWSYLHLELAPGPVSVPAVSVAVTAGLDERLQPGPSPLDSWTHTEGRGREGEGAWQRTGVTQMPWQGQERLSCSPWGSCPGAGVAVLCPGAVPSGAPRAAPQLRGPAGLGLHPSPSTQRPHGSFRKLLLHLAPRPSLPCPSPLCCRTGLSSITCDSLGRLSCVGLSGNTFVWFLCPCASESVDF